MSGTPRVLTGLLVASSVLSGCISYGLDRLPPAVGLPAPIAPERRPSVAYAIHSATGSDYQFAIRGEVWGLRDASAELGNALTTSGQFRSVVALVEGTQSDADLDLDVVLVVDANDVIMAASACLLFVIPTWRTVTFDLVAEARAKDGRWRRYELSDAARDINWLPLVLGMSFAPWGGAYSEVRDNLYATLLQRLHEDGFLAPVGG